MHSNTGKQRMYERIFKHKIKVSFSFFLHLRCQQLLKHCARTTKYLLFATPNSIWKIILITKLEFHFQTVSQNSEKRLLTSSYVSVRLHRTCRLPQNRFSWNELSDSFPKFYRENICTYDNISLSASYNEERLK